MTQRSLLDLFFSPDQVPSSAGKWIRQPKQRPRPLMSSVSLAIFYISASRRLISHANANASGARRETCQNSTASRPSLSCIGHWNLDVSQLWGLGSDRETRTAITPSAMHVTSGQDPGRGNRLMGCGKGFAERRPMFRFAQLFSFNLNRFLMHLQCFCLIDCSPKQKHRRNHNTLAADWDVGSSRGSRGHRVRCGGSIGDTCPPYELIV